MADSNLTISLLMMLTSFLLMTTCVSSARTSNSHHRLLSINVSPASLNERDYMAMALTKDVPCNYSTHLTSLDKKLSKINMSYELEDPSLPGGCVRSWRCSENPDRIPSRIYYVVCHVSGTRGAPETQDGTCSGEGSTEGRCKRTSTSMVVLRLLLQSDRDGGLTNEIWGLTTEPVWTGCSCMSAS